MCTSAVPDILTFVCSIFIHMFLLCCSKNYFYTLEFCITTFKWPWTSMGKSLDWHHHKDKCFLHSEWKSLSKQLPTCVLKEKETRWWNVSSRCHVHPCRFSYGRNSAETLIPFFFLSDCLFMYISASSLTSYVLL